MFRRHLDQRNQIVQMSLYPIVSEKAYLPGVDEGRHERKHYKSRSRSKSINKIIKGKCYHCHKPEHYRRDCPERNISQDKVGELGELQVASNGYDSAEVLCVSDLDNYQNWISDSGCSFHMCPNRSWFESFQQENGGRVILGNNKTCQVQRIGTVGIKMQDSMKRILCDVRYVPDLRRNLISLGALDYSGYSFKAENGKLRVSKGSFVVMKGTRSNGLYILQGKTISGSATVTEQLNDSSKLWHLRLAHISER